MRTDMNCAWICSLIITHWNFFSHCAQILLQEEYPTGSPSNLMEKKKNWKSYSGGPKNRTKSNNCYGHIMYSSVGHELDTFWMLSTLEALITAYLFLKLFLLARLQNSSMIKHKMIPGRVRTLFIAYRLFSLSKPFSTIMSVTNKAAHHGKHGKDVSRKYCQITVASQFLQLLANLYWAPWVQKCWAVRPRMIHLLFSLGLVSSGSRFQRRRENENDPLVHNTECVASVFLSSGDSSKANSLLLLLH